jgi:hypothetical protein
MDKSPNQRSGKPVATKIAYFFLALTTATNSLYVRDVETLSVENNPERTALFMVKTSSRLVELLRKLVCTQLAT